MAKKKKPKWPRTDGDIAFEYYEQMKAVLRDLENIDRLIPAESSRSPFLRFDKAKGDIKEFYGEASYIIDARKNDLLGYIQTIARDHIEWGKRLVDRGWTVEQWEKREGRREQRRK